MTSTMKITNEILTSALRGIPIVGLVENWSFRIAEVAPYVFNAYGDCVNYQTVIGYGGTAESALKDCIRKVEKIISRNKRRLRIEKFLSRLRNRIVKKSSN